jgi:hypothetical protein
MARICRTSSTLQRIQRINNSSEGWEMPEKDVVSEWLVRLQKDGFGQRSE